MKIPRVIIQAFGVFFILWGFFNPSFRDTEGFPRSTFLFPVAIGIALIILGITYAGSFRKSALWFALALVGQAASLQLIFAGKSIHYQHYRLIEELFSSTYIIYTSIVIIQAGLVIYGLSKYWRSIRSWLSNNVQGWQLLIIGIFFVLSSAALSRIYTYYILEVICASLIQIINLATLIMVILSIPDEGMRRVNRVFKKVTNCAGYVFIIAGCVFILLVTLCLSYFIYQYHPHLQDEVLYIYQATYFSQGLLKVAAPLVPEAFTIYMIPYLDSEWYAPFPPGWPGILALGIILKVPWLVNPLLSSINIFLAYILFKSTLPNTTARLATVLLCTSPWFILMGMNFMSHTFMLTCALTASVGISLLVRKKHFIWGCMAGLSIGMLSLIRQLDALVMGLLIGIPLLFVTPKRFRFLSITTYLISAMIVGGINLSYNQAITGDPLKFPLNQYYETYYGPNTYALGFGPDRGIDWPIDPMPGYSPIEAVINAALNTHSLNTELLGWSTGSLLFVLFAVFWGYRHFRKIDYLMLASVILIALFYGLFWFGGGPDFGARYWYLMIIPLIYLSARGIVLIKQKMPEFLKNKVYVFVLALCLLTMINYLPWRAFDKYYHYLDMRPDIRSMIPEKSFGKSLILVQGQSHPDFESAWTYNQIDLSADLPIFAYDKDQEVRSRVLAVYPDRPVWILAGPTITDGAYQIIAGPLTSSEAETYK